MTTKQEKYKKVIDGLKCCKRAMYGEVDEHGVACNLCPYKDMESTCHTRTQGKLIEDALSLLKAQKEATIEPKRIDLEEETKAWLDEMDAVDALGSIANICQDWDGYRTADGLGGLVNEIWAYARYCADRLEKMHGAVEPVPSVDDDGDWLCGNCYQRVVGEEELDASGFVPVKFNFCPNCGRKVKWE